MAQTRSEIRPRRNYLLAALVGVAGAALILALVASVVHAGTDTTFDDLNTMMTDWSRGSLGKALALTALLLGIGVAAARQSFGALFGGVAVAAAASIGPGVVDHVITALF